MVFKYSITLASFRGIEPLEETLERLVQQGYDAVEMFGEPENLDLKHLGAVFRSYDIPVCGITGLWGRVSEDGWKRKFLSSDQSYIKSSEKYVEQCIEMCEILGGKEVNICLFAEDKLVAFDRTHTLLSDNQKASVFQKVIPILSRLSKLANDHGIQLLLEPLNRYSTPYCTTVKDALAVTNQINQDNFGILLDTFHMNIEEESFENAIATSKGLLRHSHFADNNRKMPGYAHIDFQHIIQSLKQINYDHFISFEPNLDRKEYEPATKKGLDFIKKIESD